MAVFEPPSKRRRMWEDGSTDPTPASTFCESTSTTHCVTPALDQKIGGKMMPSGPSYESHVASSRERNKEVHDQPEAPTVGSKEDVCFGMVQYAL